MALLIVPHTACDLPLGPAPPGTTRTCQLEATIPMHGPIALLLFSTHQLAAGVSQGLVLHSADTTVVFVLHTRHQHIRYQISELGTDARLVAASSTRKAIERFCAKLSRIGRARNVACSCTSSPFLPGTMIIFRSWLV